MEYQYQNVGHISEINTYIWICLFLQDGAGLKLSYAQILAQKNREAANANNGVIVDAPVVNTVITNSEKSAPAVSPGQTAAVPPGNAAPHKGAPVGNGLREQPTGPPQSVRPNSRPIKDNSSRVEGPPNSRPINGRRNSGNSKENRDRVIPGKFDRRKADNRAK